MAGLDWALRWKLRQGRDGDQLRQVRAALSALGDGVQRCSEIVDEAERREHPECADAVIDEQCDVVETLLGAAFTVCQTHIAAVVADVHWLHKLAANPPGGTLGANLTTTSTKKSDIVRCVSAPVAGSGVTAVEAINGLANYFKHRDEWPSDWSSFKGRSAATVKTISAIGLSWGSTGNLRRGSEALGNTSYNRMGVFADILGDWHEHLMHAYEQELRATGFLPAK